MTVISLNRPATVVSTNRVRNHIFSRLQSLQDCKNFEEAISKAKMDFVAFKKPLLIPTATKFDPIKFKENPEFYTNPDHCSIHHEDGEYLATVGSNYGIVQYKDIFEFSRVLVEGNEADYQYGGISGHGAQAYLVMKTAEFIELSPQDRIECYFYFVSSHNRSTGLNLIPSPIRTANNIVMLFPGVSALKFRHSKHVNNRLIAAKKSIEKIRTYFKKFEESFRDLATVELTKDLEEVYLRNIFPDGDDGPSTRTENIRNKIKDIIMTEPSLQFPSTKRTLLGAYFAVIQYADHYMTVRKTGEKDETAARIESSIGIDGAAAKRKAEALSIALKFK